MGLDKKVDTRHPDYSAYLAKWVRTRDCYEGSDSVKGKGQLYLSPLDSHSTEADGAFRYTAYVRRALFYNATGRTVDGLAGSIFQKTPYVEVPSSIEEHLHDLTLTGVTLELTALRATREILTTGRYGILVDMADAGRPYWVPYRAEDITNWWVERIGGDPTLTMVTLREQYAKQDPTDPFVSTLAVRYRVIQLIDGKCFQSTWERDQAGLWLPKETVVLLRLGQPVPFIPFVFIGPTSTSSDVEKPPLLDLVDVNLSHYRTSADLEHGRHFTALPQPWIAGVGNPDETGSVQIGSGGVWILEKGGEAGMLEFTGQGLRALETADSDKRKMMATLGARLLEEQGGAAETATAVMLRHAGEHATLRTVAQAVEQALGDALRIHAWWSPGSGLKNPGDADVVFELNKDFFNIRMTAEELKSWVMALQAGSISHETFWSALTRGGVARPATSEEEQKLIKETSDEIAPQPGAPVSLPPKGDQIVDQENPYSVVKRGGKYLVVKNATGKTVPGGDHGLDSKAAGRHLAALEANVKD